MPHFVMVLIPYIHLLNLLHKKMSIFEEYGAFKSVRLVTANKLLIKDDLILLLIFEFTDI